MSLKIAVIDDDPARAAIIEEGLRQGGHDDIVRVPGVSAYVVDGLRPERVKAVLDTAIHRYRAFARLKAELQQARSELEDRKLIDRAKAILGRRKGLSEEEAYRLLRPTAMNENRRIAEVAGALITAAALLE